MIIRANHEGNFTIVPNAIVEHQQLPIEAKGLLCYLISRPPKWRVRHEPLQRALHVGREKLQRLFRELARAGYAERAIDQPRDSENRFASYDYVIRDVPKDAASGFPRVDFPQRDSRRREIDRDSKKEDIKTERNKSSPQPPSAVPAELQQVADWELTEFGRHAWEAGCRFVFENSRPFVAWRAQRGDDGMPPIDVVVVNGQSRRGVWLPSLYPRAGRGDQR
jgi:hypothetical protein